MIAGCPTCAARYRIDTAKLRPEGARLRCSRCETVFRVQAPVETPTAPAARPRAETATTAPAATHQNAPAAPQPPAPAALDPARLVLVAHPEQEAGKHLADTVASWGLSTLLVHDGVEAILNIQRSLPRVVVLDAALPKMFGFQVCELMKRNEQLRAIPVVLIGAIHDRDRYRRSPEELYGADAYAERHELPGALAEQLVRFGVVPAGARPAQPSPPVPAPPQRAVPEPVAELPVSPPAAPVAVAELPVSPPAAPVAAPAEPAASATADATAMDPETEKGMRLARIIVSDVILYNPEKFEAGIRAGNVVEALASELEEGFALFAQRVDASVCEPREFLERELVRVARSRGMG